MALTFSGVITPSLSTMKALLFLSLCLTFEPSESHGFYPGIFMNNGRQSSHRQTSDHTAEIENDEQEMIEEMIEETMEKIRQLMWISKFYRGQGNSDGREMPLLSPLSVFGLPRLAIDY